MTKPVLFIRPKSRGHRVVCDSKENGNAWDFFDKRKLRCRVDQAQRIHRAEYRLWSTLNGLVDPALRALIHPTSTGRKIMRAGDLDKYTSTNDHSSVRCTFNARPR